MSKPRYKWWSYVKWMIRLYPERVAELRRRQSAAVTPRYGGTAGGGAPSRTTENLGLASLGRTVDREVAAVRLAIEDTETLPDCAERLLLVDLVFWKHTHTLTGACDALHVSERTGQQWHAEFIYAVARHFDLL